jgi:hypothetical protein
MSDATFQNAPVIDNHTGKFIVGVIAITLPVFTYYLALPERLDSISASYWASGDWPRNIFVGFLFAVGAFLLAYNGYSRLQMKLSKLAGFAAVGIAMFPCGCGGHPQIIPGVHYVCAAIMFGVLAFFCYVFLIRAWAKPTIQARIRAMVYALCGLAMVTAIVAIGIDAVTGVLSQQFPSFTFWAETTALVAFGIAWLTASRILPLITAPNEQLGLLT